MKEIIAIVRRHQVPASKKALEEAGFNALTIQSVEGHGKQKGMGGWAAEVDPQLRPLLKSETPAGDSFMKWVPKRMLTLAVQDDEVEKAVNALIKVNQTGHIGDGKLFICPLEEVVRVRTGENGPRAIS
ncbi:nitrogen regulatory protein P-II [Syntrophobotulus glycolicus DSM 8271]|uniref:Nitrogen regulatory protein P-II n=1 Tax=Syntrophobotulus glycolicus (strain DSM 8271 / FlGlyR) TaxID=645991 RepID=F0SYK0_SYNGF|nr:P-II family nitrogen regulator [Syntrophobotulus glycolicus]ADY57112.1 nitrogen regulatory protein P-II [Syntrophobotulus glycolicus DSM 8271]